MLFRQFFDHESHTYTYLLADEAAGEALLIDPVFEQAHKYVSLLKELDIRLVMSVDTHIHADHITALNLLSQTTGCSTGMGELAATDCVTDKFADGDVIHIGGLDVQVIATPGHTDDSISFLAGDRVFTGDTLLIRGTGRTDFQNGDSAAQYDSLFNRLLKLPPQTLVYPAHDYNGMTVSTIREERLHNPRLQVKSKSEYVDMMESLDLADPRKMDLAVPANLNCGVVFSEFPDMKGV